MYISCHGGLAQLVEQLIYTEKVTGSSPVSPTDFKERSDYKIVVSRHLGFWSFANKRLSRGDPQN